MILANPIYDVVFRYLMNDKKVAKLLISKIINREIVELEMRPSEKQSKIIGSSFTIFRIDFAATIKEPDGSQQLVIIEIQKAKLHTDIMRFRKYLGEQYQNPENSYYNEQGEKKALPIISLYFLGHKLQHLTSPIIQVKRNYIDHANNEQLTEKEEFIESLTHDSYIIQVPYLKHKRRNELEILLSVFDQSQQDSKNKHILNFIEDNYPQDYQIITRQLQKAAAEKDISDTMDIEDEVLSELQKLEREIESKDKELEDKSKSLEKAIQALISSGMSRSDAERIIKT